MTGLRTGYGKFQGKRVPHLHGQVRHFAVALSARAKGAAPVVRLHTDVMTEGKWGRRVTGGDQHAARRLIRLVVRRPWAWRRRTAGVLEIPFSSLIIRLFNRRLVTSNTNLRWTGAFSIPKPLYSGRSRLATIAPGIGILK